MPSWWQQEVLGNPLGAYIVFAVVLFAAFVTYVVLSKGTARGLERWIRERETLRQSLSALVHRPLRWVLFTVVLWSVTRIFTLPPELTVVMDNLLLALIAVTVSYVLLKALDVVFAVLQSRAERTESKLDDQLYPVLRKTAKAFVVVITALLVVQNWGYNITSLLAGLGIGGLAFALAAQDTISNLFGAITLFVDRPFHVGEAISVEGYTGSVEAIGLRTTRLRTFEGTLVTLPNSLFTKAKIENLSNRPTRRTVFTVGLVYETSSEKLERALEILREIMREHPSTAQYRAYFNSYGDFSLNILVQHWCKHLDYEEYLKALEEILLQIKRRFEAEGIEFAFPTQTIHLSAAESVAPAPN